MYVGMLNHPGYELIPQVQFAARHGFQYIDLTVEPPRSALEDLNPPEIKQLLSDLGMFAVGHTAWYIPIDSPFSLVQQGVAAEFKRNLDFFRTIEASKVTIHLITKLPDRMFPTKSMAQYCIETLAPVVEYADQLGISVMMENGPMDDKRRQILSSLFAALPSLKFHLDVGHAFIGANEDFFEHFVRSLSERLIHVHVSDNFQADDLHLPLFTGSIPWKKVVSVLKALGYDATVTLEVFSPDLDYLLISKNKFIALWNQTPPLS